MLCLRGVSRSSHGFQKGSVALRVICASPSMLHFFCGNSRVGWKVTLNLDFLTWPPIVSLLLYKTQFCRQHVWRNLCEEEMHWFSFPNACTKLNPWGFTCLWWEEMRAALVLELSAGCRISLCCLLIAGTTDPDGQADLVSKFGPSECMDCLMAAHGRLVGNVPLAVSLLQNISCVQLPEDEDSLQTVLSWFPCNTKRVPETQNKQFFFQWGPRSDDKYRCKNR